jgi:transcriptional regulator with XRE-family HTH domain
MSELETARKAAGISRAELAHAVGKSHAWLSFAETGTRPIPPEHAKILMIAIDRIRRFQVKVAEAREKLVADLKLPQDSA